MTISPSKAKELGVKDGDVVVLIGRRRRAAYATVALKKGKKSNCSLTSNLAGNLRLRQDDKVKIATFSEVSDEDARSGDLLLLKQSSPESVAAATLSPIIDSLQQLQASEGGDEISDDEIKERFLVPYTEGAEDALIKQGHVLTLRDANGKALEFIVDHVELAGQEDDNAKADDEGTSGIESFISL